ncbi:MAG: 30S ribosomal protein S6 [Candidatus Vogelbacteria bacterium]|nr:30S ribosomal protein S6 [Candidatus Vogelbacteria bacterium]
MEDTTKKLYEVGYLLIPLIPEDRLADEVNVLRSYIETANGFIIGEDQPKMRRLAYTIKQRGMASKKIRFEDAYFGWIRFQASASDVLVINDALDKNDKVLRYILIKPVKDTPRIQRVMNAVKPKVEVIKKEKRTQLSDQELDKEIDQLLDDNKVTA